ncbi:NADH-quinone oxidoreductase subunit C [Streptomyces sp. CA-132043]|uniref:NADH-quinone oxidoreductase subunit C n=1 Tax=Streptomyces sp. CA-132043 TaxID=3240048 RepID=UPI003D92693F
MTAQPPEPGTPEEPTGAAPEGASGTAPEKAKDTAPEKATGAAPEKATGAAPEGASAEAPEGDGTAEAPPAPPAPPVGWLPEPAERIFGAGATAEEAYGLLTVDVPATAWTDALTAARDALGCTYFDWLSAVDEPGTGFRVCAHVADVSRPGGARRLLVRTTVPHEKAVLPTAIDVYAGAGWHERETHEMFGVEFAGHPGLTPLLLPENFEGHPLRKDFVLAARVAKAWPGAKEPGESEHGGPKRRQMLPPGVPDPNEWGPLKGQLPPAPARPARGAARGARAAGGAGAAGRAGAGRAAGAGREAAAGAAGERPARRTRSASAGSASQQAAAATEKPESKGVEPPKDTEAPKAAEAAKEAAADPARTPEAGAPETGAAASAPRTAPRSSDAPWHHARPAFEAKPSGAEPSGAESSGTESSKTESSEAQPAREAPEEAPKKDAPENEGGASEDAPADAPEGTARPEGAEGAHGATRTDDETGGGTA